MLAVINCSQLVTLRGAARPRVGAEMRELSIIEDGAMLVGDDGRIAAVGRAARSSRSSRASARCWTRAGRVCLPGFVDAHAHPVFAGRAPGSLSSARRARRIRRSRRRAAASRERARDARGVGRRVGRRVEALRAVVSARGHDDRRGQVGLRAVGRGRVEDAARRAPSGRGDAAAIRADFLGAHEVPDEYRARRADYVELSSKRCCRAWRASGWRSSATCSARARVRRGRVAAHPAGRARARSRLRLHADQLSLSGGARLAAELGAATADHLEHTDAAASARCARPGCSRCCCRGRSTRSARRAIRRRAR
jgi:imidazolonepropionase